MKYSVKYKHPGQFFFRTIDNVKGDGLCEGVSRYFILTDESRIELPVSCHFVFSKERFLLIQKELNQQAGQHIPLK